jgi:hypothetical protein
MDKATCYPWKDILNETGAWNTLVWFSVLVLMADQLNQLGFIPSTWIRLPVTHNANATIKIPVMNFSAMDIGPILATVTYRCLNMERYFK